eukprot:RCo039650
MGGKACGWSCSASPVALQTPAPVTPPPPPSCPPGGSVSVSSSRGGSSCGRQLPSPMPLGPRHVFGNLEVSATRPLTVVVTGVSPGLTEALRYNLSPTLLPHCLTATSRASPAAAPAEDAPGEASPPPERPVSVGCEPPGVTLMAHIDDGEGYVHAALPTATLGPLLLSSSTGGFARALRELLVSGSVTESPGKRGRADAGDLTGVSSSPSDSEAVQAEIPSDADRDHSTLAASLALLRLQTLRQLLPSFSPHEDA